MSFFNGDNLNDKTNEVAMIIIIHSEEKPSLIKVQSCIGGPMYILRMMLMLERKEVASFRLRTDWRNQLCCLYVTQKQHE